MSHVDLSYLKIVDHVLNNGEWKSPVRKNLSTGKWEPVDGGVRTLACANMLFSHEMSDGFPLLTTKKMAFKTLCVELEGFIKGVTDKRWYQERNCKIWDEWANPEAVSQHTYVQDFEYDESLPREEIWSELNSRRKAAQKEISDLGPIYGYQWRHFAEDYPLEKQHFTKWCYEQHSGVYQGVDQLKNIVDALTNNPMDRRMVCSAWNPNQMHMMALPPCHYAWNVTVIGNKLHLFWAQRSCDLMLGVPFNIASYALLLCLLAEVGGFERGNLSGMLVDCHIYENHIPAAREQIKREPRQMPELQVVYNENKFDIFQWTHENVLLKGYNPHPKLDFGGVAV
jgi:thymidylate synthase